MRLKKKLLWANVGMIAIPIIFMTVAGLLILRFMYSTYWYPVELMFSDKNDLVYATSLIYNNQKKLAGEDNKNLDENLELLANKLGQLGYRFQYELDGALVFDNLDSLDKKALQSFDPVLIHKLDHIVTVHNGDTFIKIHWETGQHCAIITAVSPASVSSKVSFSFFRFYIYPFVMILFITLLSIIVFTHLMFNRIAQQTFITPLSQLTRAISAIRKGNLSTRLSAPKNNEELYELFQNFQAMQESLKTSLLRRQEISESRKELLSSISHDLRTPLTSIKGYAEGLRDGIANTEEKRIRYCNAILTRSADMERMLEDLSTYNKLNRYHWQPEQMDLASLLHDFVAEKMDQETNHHVLFIEQYDTVPMLMIDVAEFRRILYNLFNNTIKYRTKPSSVIWLTLRRLQDRVLFTYSDDGPGVRDSQLDKIFEAFYRGDQARSHTEESSGLGLSIVKKIVTLHHGTVRAYNHPGLAIEISLPITIKEDIYGTTDTHSRR